VFERNRKVEEQTCHEQEVAEPATSYRCHDQACDDEQSAEDWNAPVDRLAEMRMNSFGLSGFAFR
jgi:hypothetical protein